MYRYTSPDRQRHQHRLDRGARGRRTRLGHLCRVQGLDHGRAAQLGERSVFLFDERLSNLDARLRTQVRAGCSTQ